MRKLVLMLAVVVFAVSGAFAAGSSVIKLSLIDDAYIPQVDTVGGLDIGIISTKTQKMTGLQYNFIYKAEASEMVGLQGSFICAVADKKMTGLQSAIVDWNNGEFTGVQWGLVNISKGNVTGVQFGLVNYTETITGIQLGLVNTIKKNGWLPIMIFINGRF